MNKLKYWQKRCELAEAVIAGYVNNDIAFPEFIYLTRIVPWEKFIKETRPAEFTLENLAMFERMWINAGQSMMKIPNGHVLEYWRDMDSTPIVTESVFIPGEIEL